MTLPHISTPAFAMASAIERIRAMYAENLSIDPKPEVPCPNCDTPVIYAVEIVRLKVSFVCPGCGMCVFHA